MEAAERLTLTAEPPPTRGGSRRERQKLETSCCADPTSMCYASLMQATTTRKATAMTATRTSQNVITYGNRPEGKSTGRELWITESTEDGTTTITAYKGWEITTEIKITGASELFIAQTVYALAQAI